MDNPEIITVLSLCSGYGGLELGLSRALANPLRVVGVEIEAYALANLVAKAEEGKLAVEALWPDLRTFPAERFRGCFDFVLAGYPCQPFSVAGKRQGTDDPRHLWPAIARIVAAVEPLWCFFENVPGHLSLGFPDVYCSLRDMGYKVEAGLFTAAECGAPHKRERLFILAHNTKHRFRSWRAKPTGFGGKACIASSGELANTSGESSSNQDGQIDRRLGQEDVSQGHGQTGSIWIRATSELADARLCMGRTEQGQQQEECAKEFQRSPELADTAEFRLNGLSIRQPRRANEEGWMQESQGNRWPARPGEPQYEWEEPRVVANTKNATARTQGAGTEKRITIAGSSGRQTQSGLGLSTDGSFKRLDRSACRVDELRLLGNGVVPAQAERAFRELMVLFE